MSATEDANEHVVLNWTDNSGIETGYKVERDGGSGFVEIADLDAGTETYTDETVEQGIAYSYKVKAYNATAESDFSNIADLTTTDIGDWDTLVPDDFTLSQNYPNPFNPNTVIRYGLPNESHVKVVVYNLLGQKVITLVDKFMSAGYHEIIFDASKLNSGIYLYKIDAANFTEIKKMIFLK